jgi:ureidoglycolate dehydrogenase (NAD+)
VKVTIDEIKSKLYQAALKYVSPEEAEYFALEEVDTHLKKSPRDNPLSEAIGDLENWSKSESRQFTTLVDKSATLLLDCNGLSPSLKIKNIHDELENRSKSNGIAMIGIKNSGGIHSLNLWTDGLGKRDLIGICIFNGGPNSVVPFGGTRGIFGTNPLSYAIPTSTNPILVDMATSEIPYFEINNALKNNLPLKQNVAVDNNGDVTTDAKKAASEDGTVNLLPLGGNYKGYALVLLIEILTGSLVRSFLSNEMNLDYIPSEHGGLIIAIDIASLTDLAKFKESVSSLCQVIRSQKPNSNVDKVSVPGDRNHDKVRALIEAGSIEVEDSLLERLASLQ